MQIIIEGMDNSGKTTLANRLAHDLGTSVVHLNKPRHYAERVNGVLGAFLDSKFVIRDRIDPISEMIYGPVCRSQNIWEGEQWEWIERFMQQGSIIIHCRPPAAKILDFGEREQMPGVAEHAHVLMGQYDSLFLRLWSVYPSGILSYDYTNQLDDKHTYESLLQYCRGMQEVHLKNQDKVNQLKDWGKMFTSKFPKSLDKDLESGDTV